MPDTPVTTNIGNLSLRTLESHDIEHLRALVADPKRITVGSAIHEDYSHDELHTLVHAPEVLIEVVSTAEVSAIMRYASANGIAVTARGQGTGLVGGAVSLHGGIMVSLQKMNRFLELDVENMLLTVEPGVLLMEIAEYLAPTGLFYPPDPGEKSATIGGNISTNAGGMRAVKYGVTRDYVRSLEVVLASGEVVEIGGKVAKNSSGYSIKDLMIGSEGTLGIITKATLKLIGQPKVTVSLLIPFPDLGAAIGAVPAILKVRQVPTAVEFMQREVIEAASEYLGRPFPDNSADAYLLVSCDGPSRRIVDESVDEIAQVALSHGAIDAFLADTPERQLSVWSTRGTFLEAIKASTSMIDECDVVVPRNEVASFIAFSYELQAKHGLRMMSFGHAGDGNLHIYALRDDLDEATWTTRVEAVFAAMYDRAHAVGGKVSGEHGIGFAKMRYLASSEQEPTIRLMQAIKRAFDPQGILNPGKIV
ncbi:MAG: 2-hydroxy-acid oxidase [Spirochaetae bacterium HGW-Spirochaetae-4]|nr:MAG: 2-hydroxy-acid oxidase [Spirochaetae bacterium HGW-Spirochaetae-4]HCS35304.1 2-hydroxy-acid oxidase [Sphaerochaeta sp.]